MSDLELLPERTFWDLIRSARVKAGDVDEYLPNCLITKVAALLLKMIFGFDGQMHRMLRLAYQSHLWCAAHVAVGFCSDDGFLYFRAWLIGRGKDAFYAALGNPDSLLREFEKLRSTGGLPDNESLLSVAHHAYRLKTKRDDYFETSEYDSFGSTCLSDIEFDWHPGDLESMQKICPNVYAKFWRNHIMEVFNDKPDWPI